MVLLLNVLKLASCVESNDSLCDSSYVLIWYHVFAALPISSLYPFLYYMVSFWSSTVLFFCHRLLIVSLTCLLCFHRLRILVSQRRRKILGFMLVLLVRTDKTFASVTCYSVVNLHIYTVCSNDISYYLEGCSFMLGRALTSVFWGIVADRYGRKPIILLGTISMLVSLNMILICIHLRL